MEYYTQVRKNDMSVLDNTFLDKADNNGITTLMWAARYGFKDMVNYLIEHGADVNLQDKKGMTALMHALSQSRTDIPQRLFDSPFSLRDNNGQNALIWACRKNVLYPCLLVDVNDKDNFGCTALHYASYFGYTSIVSALLIEGADPNVKNNHGETSLMLANINDRTEIILMLIAYGASKDYVDYNGFMAVDYRTIS